MPRAYLPFKDNKSLLFAAAFILLFTCPQVLRAQKTATWKGGTPGRPTEWNCPANWKEGRVPDEFSRVVIPDVSTSTLSNPVLNRGTVEIWSLQVHSGATLLIGENASLIATCQNNRVFIASGEGIIQQSMLQDSLVFVAR